MGENIIVRLVSMPASVRGFTIADQDGNYNVYINRALTRESQQDTYLHELRHIERGDLYSDKPVSEIEWD